MKNLGIILVIMSLVACGGKKGTQTSYEGFDPQKDYFPDKAQVGHAKNFTVTYHDNYKVVRTSATLGEWGSASSEVADVEDVIVLVQRGTPPPALTGNLENATCITIPATDKIATNGSVLELWLEMLGLDSQQVAVGGTKTYDDSLRNQVISGKIGEVGYSWAAPPDMEVLTSRNPNIFLMVLSRIGFNGSLSKLRELNIPTAAVFDWAEKDYLGRAEWIKYVSLFFNKEKQAELQFEQIEQSITSLKRRVSAQKTKPVCVWGHFVDNGFWLANVNNAEARLLKDAGVINPIEDFGKRFNPVGEAFTSEEWLQATNAVEHWIVSTGVSPVLLPDNSSYLGGLEAWRKDNLYHHYLRSKPEHNAFDWYNLSATRPDLVLEDLVALFYPNLLPDHQFTFFGKYQKEAS